MGKKKQEDPPKGSPAWMATFSDLMNLLLCFFVLLFSMSSVDEAKAEAMIKSLANTFSIFSGGGSSFTDGSLISNGANQLNNLDQYFATMGQTAEGTENSEMNQNDNKGEDNEPGDTTDPGKEDRPEGTVTPSPTPTPTYEEIEKAENKEQTGVLYDEVNGFADRYNLGEYVQIGVDEKQFQYVRIDITGSVLFASGQAELKQDAMPILSSLGDVLKYYAGYGYVIEVIGHTDNVPVPAGLKYKDNMELSCARAVSVARFLTDKNAGKGIDPTLVYYSGRGEWEPLVDNETAENRDKNRRVEIRLYNKKNSDK